jgi:hypothetical protein
MTFLSPVYLVAVLGAAIPVIIHLLAKRLARGQEFSSLIFLTEIEQRALRWVRLQERWLLAIRIALVLLMALALARPSCGTRRMPDATLLVMDVSASMGSDEGAVWHRALHAAARVGDALGLEITGLAIAGTRLRVIHAGTMDRDDILDGLERLVPGGEALHSQQILNDAVAFARMRGYQRLRLIFVSDFQPTNWDDVTSCPPEIEIVGVPIAGVPTNLAFGEISMLGIAGSEHGSVEVRGSILQFGENAADSCLVTIRWNDVEHHLRLPLLGRETVFARKLGGTSPGLMTGELVLDDTRGVALDNKRAAALFVPAKQKVVVMGRKQEQLRRVALALDPTGRQDAGFDVVTVSADALDRRALDSAHAIVVLQAPGPRTWWEQLHHRWERGTGLVLVADSEHLTEEEASFFARVANGMPAAQARIGPGEPDIVPGDVNYDHPILSVFRDFSAAGVSLPTVWRLRGWNGDQGTVLIGLQKGAPLLIEGSARGGGPVVVWLTGLVPPWSDWSSRASFVPLWRRTVGYACGIETVTPIRLGEERLETILCSGEDCAVRLEYSDGSIFPLIPEDVVPPVAQVRLGPFFEPGLYVLWAEGRPVRLLATVVDDEELSASSPSVRPPVVNQWWEYKDGERAVVWIQRGAPEATGILILAALGMLVVETFVAARVSGPARPKE